MIASHTVRPEPCCVRDCTCPKTPRPFHLRSKIDIALSIADTVAIFPFHIPIPIPRAVWNVILRISIALRIIPPTGHDVQPQGSTKGAWKVLRFHMSIIIAPVIADLFLLATLAIGREEVRRGEYALR